MKRLLMLNSGYFEIPLILAAKNQGFYVITTGNNTNAPAHKYANEYINFDYSDYDGMVNLAKKLKIDAISQGCSDNCALTAAYIGEKLGVKGHDSFKNAQIIHRKDCFKKFVSKYQIHSPLAYQFNNIDEALKLDVQSKLPLIVKPNDQAGGKGVTKVCDAEEYKSAVNKAFLKSNAKSIVVEPFLDGSLHSFTTFIVNKKVKACATFNDYSFVNKFLTNSGISPADDAELAQKLLIPEVEFIANKLGLVDGLLHMQYIMKDGQPWIIEMMRRMPGNNYVTALTRATGLDWCEWIIKAESGKNCSGIPESILCKKYFGYHAVMSNKNGIFHGLEVKKEFKKYLIDLIQYEEDGTVIDDYLYQKLGLAQFYFNNNEEKDYYMKKINEMICCINNYQEDYLL